MSHLQWQRREKFSFLHIMINLGVDYSRSTMLDYFLTPGESTLVDRLRSTMKYGVKTDFADFDDFSRPIVDSILPWVSKNRLDYNPSTIVDSRQKKAKEIPQKMPIRLRTKTFDYIRVDYLPSLDMAHIIWVRIRVYNLSGIVWFCHGLSWFRCRFIINY